MKEEELALHPNRGNIFESFVLADLIKWKYNHGEIPKIYFWQDKTGHEIDCIIENGQVIIPIEIKASRTVSQRFFTNFEFWNSIAEHPTQNYIVYAGPAKQIRGMTSLYSWQSIDTVFEKQ